MKRLLTLLFFLFFYTATKSQSYIIAYEYWCDTAYSSRVLVSVPPQQLFVLDTLLEFPGVSKGLHLLNIRFQQNNFFWSHTVYQYFYKTGEAPSVPGNITAYRYWVEGIDSVVTFHLSTPMSPFDLTADIDLSWVPAGPTKLYVQFGDEAGNWSVATVDSVYKTVLPVASFRSDDTITCGLDSVHFQNLSIDANKFQWYFGDGDSSSLEHPVHLYQQPGTYTVTLEVTDTVGGGDSTVTIVDYISVFDTAVASFSFTQTDSIVTFINNSQNATSYLWDFGDSTTSNLQDPIHTYSYQGNFTVVLTAFDTCGSVTDTQYVSIILGKKEIYSNPGIRISQTTGAINIHFDKETGRCNYKLENISGQVLITGRLENVYPGLVESIPADRLASGIYFLDLISSSDFVRRKVMIAH